MEVRYVMKWRIWGERRQRDRRQNPIQQEDEGRKAQRRKAQRRNLFRVIYPRTAAPKVLNADYRIVNLSQKGILFICEDGSDECSEPITLKSLLDLKIQFHDGVTLDIQVKITRCQSYFNSNKNSYAGIITQGISAERINKEQAYVLKLFPNFSRASRDSSVESREALLLLREED
jgi:hypothetical protein